jgi:hypothetical protein
MIKGRGLDRFWTDPEVYRCREGNQQLTEKFAAALNKKRGRVKTGARVRSISRHGKQWLLKVVDEEGAALPEIEPVDEPVNKVSFDNKNRIYGTVISQSNADE